jgi:hypothetical protein
VKAWAIEKDRFIIKLKIIERGRKKMEDEW